MLDRLFLFLALVLVCSARGGWEGKGEGRFNYTEEENPSFSQEFSMTTYMGVDVMRTQLGDFNGDGVQDVFIYKGDFGGKAQKCDIWLANVLAGTPPTIKSYTHVSGPTLPALSTVVSQAQVTIQRVVLVDWNNDGCTDIYLLNDQGGHDTVYIFNKTASSFTTTNGPKPGYAFSTNPSTALLDLSRYHFADFNADGYQDLFYIPGRLGDDYPPEDIVYLNQNATTYEPINTGFRTPLSLTTALATFQLDRIKFRDFNGDNCADMYVVNQGNGPDSLSLGSKTGQFTTVEGPATPISSILTQAQIDLSRVQFGDFNADGLVDVYFIAGNMDAAVDTIWFYRGGSRWTKGVGLQRKLYIGSYSTTAQADLNGIQFLNMDPTVGKGTDVYQMINGFDNIYFTLLTGQFYDAKGKGAYTPLSPLASTELIDVSRALFGDLNGDGVVDIYWVNGQPETTQKDILKLAPSIIRP